MDYTASNYSKGFTLSHKTTTCQQACLPGPLPTRLALTLIFFQITELSGSCWYEPRFAHFSPFLRRKPCISLRLRSPSDENWSVTHLFLLCMTYFGSTGRPSTTCGKASLHVSGLRGQSSPSSKPSSSTSQETSADLISRYRCCCCASTLSIPLKNSLNKKTLFSTWSMK